MTVAEVLALAPDGASAKAGQSLSGPREWVVRAHDDDALWGECKGSAKEPYRASVARATSAYACSCPSRKFPCKHVLGLMLAFASGDVAAGTRPEWVTSWLDGRKAREERARAKTVGAPTTATDPGAADDAAKKRLAAREKRIAEGLTELERFVADVMRLGLAHARTQPASFWETRAARLVDAQCPGLARRVRDLPSVLASGAEWEGRTLAKLGELALLARAYARRDALPEALRADVRRHVGWTTTHDEIVARAFEVIDDTWTVLGSRVVADERLAARRTWFAGERSGRTALVLQFAPSGVPPEVARPGTRVVARSTFVESAAPLRAVLLDPRDVAPAPRPRGLASIDAAHALVARALAGDPWLERFALTFDAVTPQRANDRWVLRDAHGDEMALARDVREPRALDALAGGAPLVVAGEWSDVGFYPLGVWTGEGRYVDLESVA
jgi:hypothetical protein